MPIWLVVIRDYLPQWGAVALLGIYVFQSSKRNLEQHSKIVLVLGQIETKIAELHDWHNVDTPGKPGQKIWWEQADTLMHHSTVLHEIKASAAANGGKLAQVYSTTKANQEILTQLERDCMMCRRLQQMKGDADG